MIKVKIFESYNTERVEKEVNIWLTNHTTYDIIDIQYQTAGSGRFSYSVMVRYLAN